MHSPEIHGVTEKKISRIPKIIFNKAVKFSLNLIISTEKIIIGILKIITIILPRVKFLLFNKFIDDDIEPINDKIKEPIRNVKIKMYTSLIGRLKKMQAIGIEAKKGICTKKKCDSIFKKTINS